MSVSIEMTSDWATVSFVNCSATYTNYRVNKGLPFPDMQLDFLTVRKHSMDSTQVSVTFDVLLDCCGENPEIVIQKGNIGYAVVDLARDSLFIAQFVNRDDISGDPTNRMSYELPKDLLGSDSEGKSSKYENSKLCFAFYYAWYSEPSDPTTKNTNHWFKGEIQTAVHTPQLGFYASSDPGVIRQHILWAKEAGIDGFIVSWWGEHEGILKDILRIAEELNFKISLYYELVRSLDEIRGDIVYIVENFAKSPAFLAYAGKPVIFWYDRTVNLFSLEEWREIFSGSPSFNIADGSDPRLLESFDGIHLYHPARLKNIDLLFEYRSLSQVTLASGKIFAATVSPGYDNTRLGGATCIPRDDGQYYAWTWESALASHPNWILISTFNEWEEGSEIEPSTEFGMDYIYKTRRYIQRFQYSQ